MNRILICILSLFIISCNSNENNKVVRSNSFFEGRIELVETLLKNKDYQRVIVLCDSAFFFDSLQPLAYFYKGRALSELKEYDKSNLNLMNAYRLGIKDTAKFYFYIADNYLLNNFQS